jgi:dUTP pyrophosphatase
MKIYVDGQEETYKIITFITNKFDNEISVEHNNIDKITDCSHVLIFVGNYFLKKHYEFLSIVLHMNKNVIIYTQSSFIWSEIRSRISSDFPRNENQVICINSLDELLSLFDHPYKCEKLHQDVIVPKKQTPGSAGFDLHAFIFKEDDKNISMIEMNNKQLKNYDFPYKIQDESKIFISPNKRVAIPTGIRISFPNYMCFDIRPRSGLSLKYGIDVLGGTIDSDYRGEIFVLLINEGDTTITIESGERIAQLVPRMLYPIKYEHKHSYTFYDKFQVVDSVDKTLRGEGGFGSTGI